MICEPYINTGTGEIQWIDIKGKEYVWADPETGTWTSYVDFERAKLKELDYFMDTACCPQWRGAFRVHKRVGGQIAYSSGGRIGYMIHNYVAGSESSRLLKRSEFLKAVCEKEGVEWIKKEVPVFMENPPRAAYARTVKNEEKEWREALLIAIERVIEEHDFGALEDLRKRFT